MPVCISAHGPSGGTLRGGTASLNMAHAPTVCGEATRCRFVESRGTKIAHKTALGGRRWLMSRRNTSATACLFSPPFQNVPHSQATQLSAHPCHLGVQCCCRNTNSVVVCRQHRSTVTRCCPWYPACVALPRAIGQHTSV